MTGATESNHFSRTQFPYLYDNEKRQEDSKVFFFLDFIYLFMRDTQREREREAETQAEGEAGSMQRV